MIVAAIERRFGCELEFLDIGEPQPKVDHPVMVSEAEAAGWAL